MPLLIFIIMYTAGVMLAFANESVFRGYYLNVFLRTSMFLKAGRRKIFIHIIVFQGLNMLFFMTLILIYAFSNEKIPSSVYNIYKWTAVVMFAAILLIEAVDAALVEKFGKGRKHESN